MRCNWCAGEGEWSQPYPLAGYGSEYMDCPKCEGTGRVGIPAKWLWVIPLGILLAGIIEGSSW